MHIDFPVHTAARSRWQAEAAHKQGFAEESRAVTSLQTICTSAGKHLVDTDNVVRMETDTDVEVILSNRVDHVLVGTDTGSLKRLGGDHLLLEGQKVHACRELIATQLLLADIKDLDLSLCAEAKSLQYLEDSVPTITHNYSRDGGLPGTPRQYLDLMYGLFLM